ncbi:MAG: ATPase, T2SS/T4P/T4SS family [Betaproteobacteria bacterium]|nr:ATPase, T2SS/T4P/T4SS family [Betaproteobacteria bacterium]
MFRINVTNPRGKTETTNCAASASVGKSDENLVLLQGWQVAKKHATLYQNDQSMFVKDEGSSHGTRVNGKKISGVYGPLRASDMIEIGAYTITVEILNQGADESPIAAPEAPPPAAARVDAPSPAASAAPQASQPGNTERFATLRLIQERLISRMDFRRIDTSQMGETELRQRTRELIEEIIGEDPAMSIDPDRDGLVQSALHEAVGLGPLEVLLADDSVSEVMVNRHDQVFVERSGRLMASEVVFSSDKAVLSAIERIIAPLGRRIDESSPMVDGRLKDGSRVNAIIPPLALKGPCITIRKFSKRRLNDDDVVAFNSANKPMMAFLRLAVEQRRNILISGGTGSGKTTLLNILSNFVPDGQRVVTIEDAAELRLYQPNLVSMEARPANIEGQGAVTIRDLVRNSLRMRPDRIVVGECRGGEALDMLQAMNTGHDGSLTTVHANTPRDTLSRLEVMVLMAGMDLPIQAIRQQIASAVNIIVQQTRFSCGSRKITYVTEVTGMENGVIQLQDLFLFQQQGYGPDGKIQGKFVATGRIPEFYEDLQRRGIEVDRNIFFQDKDGGRL